MAHTIVESHMAKKKQRELLHASLLSKIKRSVFRRLTGSRLLHQKGYITSRQNVVYLIQIR